MSARPEKLLSIVVPAFNESAGIQGALRTLADVCRPLPYAFELIVVDDGSVDDTYARAVAVAEAGIPVRAIRLSRNFGKEAALLAGLQNARGAAVITIDADLQHPPSLIPAMVAAWERGAKVVHGVKRDRGDKHWWGTARAYIFNAVIEWLGGIDVQNSSDFKLLDRVVVDILTKRVPERRRFYRGLTNWIGYSQATLEFDVAPRMQGKSGFSLRSLVALALTATVSFTSAPLRIVTVLGVLTFVLGFGVGSDALWSWSHGASVSGFMTLITTLLLLGSFIMISLGVIGEYIAKIYDESKQRPAFIIDSLHEYDRAAESDRTLRDLPAWPMQFLESTHDAIVIWEMGGRGIVYWNSAAERLYGYSRGEALGQSTHTLLKTKVAGGVTQLEKDLARFGVWVSELRHTARDGRELLVEGNLSLLSQENGYWLVLEVNRDVTDQRRAAGAHEAMQQQLVNLQLLHRAGR